MEFNAKVTKMGRKQIINVPTEKHGEFPPKTKVEVKKVEE